MAETCCAGITVTFPTNQHSNVISSSPLLMSIVQEFLVTLLYVPRTFTMMRVSELIVPLTHFERQLHTKCIPDDMLLVMKCELCRHLIVTPYFRCDSRKKYLKEADRVQFAPVNSGRSRSYLGRVDIVAAMQRSTFPIVWTKVFFGSVRNHWIFRKWVLFGAP